MNELSILNSFIISTFDAMPLVNTISVVPTLEMNANKENIYPIVNVDLTDLDIQDDAYLATYKCTVVQLRDVKPRVTDSKLLNDTNLIDNQNETSSICAKFINTITRLHNDQNIMIESISKLTPLKNWSGGLDGFQFDVELSIHNKGLA